MSRVLLINHKEPAESSSWLDQLKHNLAVVKESIVISDNELLRLDDELSDSHFKMIQQELEFHREQRRLVDNIADAKVNFAFKANREFLLVPEYKLSLQRTRELEAQRVFDLRRQIRARISKEVNKLFDDPDNPEQLKRQISIVEDMGQLVSELAKKKVTLAILSSSFASELCEELESAKWQLNEADRKVKERDEEMSKLHDELERLRMQFNWQNASPRMLSRQREDYLAQLELHSG
ncbi:hypothetical protein IWX47DRAFT_925878 [Phyllosticta citricarpa]